MKKTTIGLIFILIAIYLISCSNDELNGKSPEETIHPGDTVGEMTIEQSTMVPYQSIWNFCEIFDETEPFSRTTKCDIPAVSSLDIQIGWFATETKFQSNWDSMTWKVSIDGEVIDLNTFDWVDTEYPQHGENNYSRVWTLTIKDLTPGEHTFVNSWTTDTAIDDGFATYQAGTYKQTTIFTVQERKTYPSLSTNPGSGQNAYSSADGDLTYLLYLPDNFGEDPAQEWPLILYLHGAIWRGATPEMLVEESLPKKLSRENDFPFIVISPLGEGEFEFWATDIMIARLITMLEELQTKLSIDPSRIYLTGNDMGGNGVWEIALQYPDYFAALAPVSGYFGYPFEVPDNICDLKNIPVWAFHGERDEEIPLDAEQQLVDALNTCGGNAQLTISREMQIDVRYSVYEREDLYIWLLEQSLK